MKSEITTKFKNAEVSASTLMNRAVKPFPKISKALSNQEGCIKTARALPGIFQQTYPAVAGPKYRYIYDNLIATITNVDANNTSGAASTSPNRTKPTAPDSVSSNSHTPTQQKTSSSAGTPGEGSAAPGKKAIENTIGIIALLGGGVALALA